MQQQIDKIEKMVTDQKESLSRIETALFGDERSGIDGVIKELKSNRSYIEKDKKLKWTIGGGIGLLVLIKEKLLQIIGFH
jgi:hypothetical protein